MTFLTHAVLRHDTVEARDYARQALESAKKDAGHRLIWGLFSKSPEDKRSFIFRATDFGDYLIVSQTQPAYDPNVWKIKSRPYDPLVKKGQSVGFSIRINPSIDLSQPDRKRSKRADVVMHAKKTRQEKITAAERERIILDWMEGKLQKAGATLNKDLSLLKDYTQVHLERKTQRATLTMASVDGVLTVSDDALFKKALIDGLGHGKAFGLGLLLIRPLAQDTDDA